MKINIITIIPEFFNSYFKSPNIIRAFKHQRLEINIIDLKDYADGSFRHIDDSPYGGGNGLLLKIEPIKKSLATFDKALKICLTPRGKTFEQIDAKRLAQEKEIVLFCGHYEGIDERAYHYFDEEISIGDYILSGGEIPSLVIIDAIARLLDGALKKGASEEESFEEGLLEYPQYTKPYEFDGHKVPDILLSGNHEKIKEFNHQEALRITSEKRNDLYEKYLLKIDN